MDYINEKEVSVKRGTDIIRLDFSEKLKLKKDTLLSFIGKFFELQPDFTLKQVKAAHRNLMLKVHPDKVRTCNAKQVSDINNAVQQIVQLAEKMQTLKLLD